MDGGAIGDDVVWLTYEEIAGRLGITKASAERRAQRRKWPRRPGNDGRARVGVPLSVLSKDAGSSQDDSPDDIPDVAPVIAPDDAPGKETDGAVALRLLDRIDALEESLAAKEREAAEAREALARREGELDGLRLATEHLHDQMAQARRDADEARRKTIEAEAKAAEAAKATAEAEAAMTRLRDRGLLARLLNREG